MYLMFVWSFMFIRNRLIVFDKIAIIGSVWFLEVDHIDKNILDLDNAHFSVAISCRP